MLTNIHLGLDHDPFDLNHLEPEKEVVGERLVHLIIKAVLVVGLFPELKFNPSTELNQKFYNVRDQRIVFDQFYIKM